MCDRLITLQSLRFIASTLVVADHALGPVVAWGLLPPWMTDFRWNLGGLGVAIFFVISGYIMMRSCGARYGSVAAALDFAERRILRIVPIYWLATGLAYVHSDHRPLKLICSLAFIPYLAAPGSAMRPLVGQGWTLDYEMAFYALFGVSLLAPRKLGLHAFFAAIAAIVGVGLFLPDSLEASFAGEIALFLSRPILLLFAMGMGIALLEELGVAPGGVDRPLAAILALICLTMAIVVFARVPNRSPWPACLILWGPAIVIVAIAVGAREPRSSRGARLLTRLGDASYSVYLFHFFLILGLEKAFSWVQPSVFSAIAFLVFALAGANLLGLGLHALVEQPMNRRLAALCERRARRPAGRPLPSGAVAAPPLERVGIVWARPPDRPARNVELERPER